MKLKVPNKFPWKFRSLNRTIAIGLSMAFVINNVSLSNIGNTLESNSVIRKQQIQFDKRPVSVGSSFEPMTMMMIASVALPFVIKGVNTGIGALKNWITDIKLSQVEKEALRRQQEAQQQLSPTFIMQEINQKVDRLQASMVQLNATVKEQSLKENMFKLSVEVDSILEFTKRMNDFGDSLYSEYGKKQWDKYTENTFNDIIIKIKNLIFGANFGGALNSQGDSVIRNMYQKILAGNDYAQNQLDLLDRCSEYYSTILYQWLFAYMNYLSITSIKDDGTIDEVATRINQTTLQRKQKEIENYSNYIMNLPSQLVVEDLRDTYEFIEPNSGEKITKRMSLFSYRQLVNSGYTIKKITDNKILLDNKSGNNLWWSQADQGATSLNDWWYKRISTNGNNWTIKSKDIGYTISGWRQKHPKLRYELRVPTISELREFCVKRDSDIGNNWKEILNNRGFDGICSSEVLVCNTEYKYLSHSLKYYVYNLDTGKTREINWHTSDISILWVSRDISGSTPLIPISSGSNWDTYGQIAGFEHIQKLDSDSGELFHKASSIAWIRSKMNVNYEAPAGKVITRIEIICNRSDGHQGTYLITSGGLGQQNLSVTFESDRARDQRWQIKIYVA